jgi:hypothetical protein
MRQGGQTLVLGALFLGLLALGVMVTVNLGSVIHARIHLQDSADAAAYSAAVLEARAFNVYAFANRAQASHDVSAMVWMSYDSFIYGTEAFLTDTVGLMASLDRCSNPRGAAVVVCAALDAIPGVGVVLSAVGETLGVLAETVQAFQLALEAVDPDRIIGQVIVPTHQALNEVLSQASQALLESTLAEVSLDRGRGPAGVLEANAPEAEREGDVGPLNACLFSRAHQRAAGVFPSRALGASTWLDTDAREDSDPVARAKRAMAGVANASRFACDEDAKDGSCPDGFVTHRSLEESLARIKLGGFVGVPTWLLKALLPNGEDGAPMKYGHTKLLSQGLAKGTEPQRVPELGCRYPEAGAGHPEDNDLRAYRDASGGKGEPAGALAQGDNLGADDLYVLGLGPPGPLNPFACGPNDDWKKCWGNQRGSNLGQMVKASVWALNPRDPDGKGASLHYRLDRRGLTPDANNPWLALGLLRVSHCVGPESCGVCAGPSLDVFVANVHALRESHHPWRGMASFPNFEPGQFLEDCRDPVGAASLRAPALHADEFNQPSVFVQLHQGPKALAKGQAPLHTRGGWSLPLAGSAGVDLLDDRASLPGLAPGLNVVARAQAYYHRPGNWQEHPNFFNPYWRPRLAPVAQGRRAWPRVGEWLSFVPRTLAGVPESVLTH